MNRGVILLFTVFILLILSVVYFVYENTNGRVEEFVLGQFDTDSKNLDRYISSGEVSGTPYRVDAEIDFTTPVAQVSDKYLSFSIDISQITGGKWWNPDAESTESGSGTRGARLFDFSNPKLLELTKNLTPAYLRVGGSEADNTFYDINSENIFGTDPPEGYESVLTGKRWDELNKFVLENNLELIFTLNAGPGPRDQNNNWLPDNSAELLEYSSKKNYSVRGWELGNEVNLFWYIHGRENQVYPVQIHKDFLQAKKLIGKYYPDSLFLGQGSAFWPVLGEPLTMFYGITEEHIKRSAGLLDAVIWHYYPQQSRRGPIASRRANPTRLLKPENLDEVKTWAEKIISWKNETRPDIPVWMGETGNAQFGGEPGVSDKYIGGLWWLDQLGSLALLNHKVVIRQTLTGMNYGLIDDETYSPRPDYWNSIIWNKLMGTFVYRVDKSGDNSGKLRLYCHLTPSNREGLFTVLAINLDHQSSAELIIPELKDSRFKVYSITTDDVLGDRVLLNGKEINTGNHERLLQDVNFDHSGNSKVIIKPLSYSFISIY